MEHATSVGEIINAYKILIGNIILKCSIKKKVWGCVLDSSASG
jgi:hypothetical protein